MELKCAVQRYPWGRLGADSAVARLVSSGQDAQVDPSATYAELWMGTHPSGPSIIRHTAHQDVEGLGLSSWIADHPESLGQHVRDRFGIQLPFLFKVLSVNKALSIQAHPSKSHAEQLHADRPDIYKDGNHKPEMALALTRFEALCGFRPLCEIQHFIKVIPEFGEVLGNTVCASLQQVTEHDEDYRARLQKCFSALMSRDPADVQQHLLELVGRLQKEQQQRKATGKGCVDDDTTVTDLLLRLHSQFPGDVGCFCCLLLNHLVLQPGQAIFLGPNVPHAYLHGDCVECMACSDNVVRAGLTPKFKDVETLVRMLDYTCSPAHCRLFQPITEQPRVLLFRPPVPDFAVAKIEYWADETCADSSLTLPVRQSASLLLCVEGHGLICCHGNQDKLQQLTAGNQLAFRAGTVLFLEANSQLEIRPNLDHGASRHHILMFQAFCPL